MASFPRTLAVDLGATAVRILELGPDARGAPSIWRWAEEEIAHDPAKTGEIVPIYSQALLAALGRMSTKARACRLCLGGPAVFARILKLPAAEPSRVRAMVGFEAQQTVPAIEQALWDFQLLPSAQPGEVEALILAIKREAVEEMSAAAMVAGLKPEAATLVPSALLNCFYYNYPDAAGCSLLLDIGARATTILLVEGPRFFVRVVPLGGGAVTQAVATDLQETYAGAEILKKAKGFVHPGGAYEDSPDAAAARISKLARGVMTRLHAEVERSVTFFRSQQGGGKPTQAWLAGAGVSLGYTDLFFREKLRIPVEFFQPFRRLALAPESQALASSKSLSAWGSAVGTGLQAWPEPPVRINVLGAVAQAQTQKNRNLPAIRVAAAAAVALLLLPGVHGFWQAAKTAATISAETGRVDEASQVLQKLEVQNKKFQAASQQLAQAVRLEEERLRWPRLLAELKRHVPEGLWITSLQVLPAAAAAAAGTGAPDQPAAPEVEISGMFETKSEQKDAEAVADFQKALGESGVLQAVTVLERETPQYVDGKTDQVALKFRLKAAWPLAKAKPTAPQGESPP